MEPDSWYGPEAAEEDAYEDTYDEDEALEQDAEMDPEDPAGAAAQLAEMLQLRAQWDTMLQRHIEISLLLQDKALEALQALDPATLNIREIRDMLKVGTDMETGSRKAAMEDPPGRSARAGTAAQPVIVITGTDELGD